MMHRTPGNSIFSVTSTEINSWNRVNAPKTSVRGVSALQPNPVQPIHIRNDSGSDTERFEVMELGDPLWDYLGDGTTDLIFGADTSSTSTNQPVVLLEPIADGAVGRGVIHGLAIAKVSAGTGRKGECNASGTFTPSSDGAVILLQDPHATDETLLPVLLGSGSGGGDSIIVKTPVGGIAAATGTGPFTPGSATCTLFETYDDGGTWKLQTAGSTLTVYNFTDQTIAAEVLASAQKVGGLYFIDAASCGS